MINDDNKNDNNQEVKENAETTQKETGTDVEGEKKLGKVIPFESIRETNEEVIQHVNSDIIKPAQAAANDAAESLKAAFEDFKKQLAPLGNSLKELSAALKSGAQAVEKKSEASKSEASAADASNSDEAAKAVEPNDESTDAEKKPDGAAVAAAREAGELVTLGIDKLKSQFSNANFDLKGTVEREFANYADANLKEDEFTVDENGRRVVKVDGKFIQQHANEVIPALIRGTVGNFFKAILGENLIKVAEDKAKADAAKADGETAEANETEIKAQGLKADAEEGKDNGEHEPSKYRVEFDFSHALGDVIRNAQVSPAPATDADKHDRAVGREILIESAKIVEDSLNGKPIENVKERMEEAKERVDKPDSEKTPEEIQAVDEKHKKILELSKQFEKNMNPDK